LRQNVLKYTICQIVSSQDLHALFKTYAENFRVGGRSRVGPATNLYLVVPIYLLQALFCPDNYERIFVLLLLISYMRARTLCIVIFFLKRYIMRVCKVHWQHLKQVVCHTVALPFTSSSILSLKKKLKSFTTQKYNLQKIL
jgi:hypothetical protein